MAYIGKSPSTGVRNRFIYTATAGQTTFSGTDDHNRTLSYTDAEFTDVFLNGVKLDKSDYTATSGTSIVLDSGATVGDTLEILGFDTFSVFSGDFSQDVTIGGSATVSGDLTVDTNTLYVDSTNNRVGIGTTTPQANLDATIPSATSTETEILRLTDGVYCDFKVKLNRQSSLSTGISVVNTAAGNMAFETSNTERMRIDSVGRVLVGKTSTSAGTAGAEFQSPTSTSSSFWFTKNTSTNAVLFLNRTSTAGDGRLINFAQDGTIEGFISVVGTTVSYNGGHLSRLSQLADATKDTSILKGTVMTNLDQMAVWSHDAVEAQDAVLDDDGNVVTEAVEAKDAYTEDNEQLNCMAVSSVEGDTNVAGVFVNWDEEDDGFNDMNVAMTGDMVIRIAQGTTVARGDLLMSAGDGTAKPQGDDIVRSKTIAKVTSTQVSHTYDDGTYLVPCVLMAC